MKKVLVFGAKTIEKYSKQILVQGLVNNGIEATLAGHLEEADALIFQLHGAPEAESDDKKIIELVEEAIEKRSKMPIVVIVHRPDEIQKFKELKIVLSKAGENIGLVLFGNQHLNDEFFNFESIAKRVIPHGFFTLDKKIQTNPIVIGSHTTWGEMRSIEHALKLILEIFRLNNGAKEIIGYLGGKPKEELVIENLEKKAKEIDSGIQIKFKELKSLNKIKGNTVLVTSNDSKPEEFELTFNIQIYYLGNKIRTGESSGSLHRSTGIPVCLEVNDAEKIEGLHVIKVPYRDVNNIDSIDFETGARKIIEAIENGEFREMLEHNLKQASLWNNTRIGKEYLTLFEELKKRPLSKQ